jgi:transposase
VLQFLEGLSDRQAAEAVRARIDWKYALSLELGDAGFDFSVLSEFRARLVADGRELLLLDRMLERFAARGLVKARGRQRTDSGPTARTCRHVLAAVRELHRVELLGATFRAALNAIAAAAPAWLRGVAPPDWYARYARRVEDARLPRSAAGRDAYVRTVGADGAALLTALATPGTPTALAALPAVTALRTVWAQQFATVWAQQFEPVGPNDGPPAHTAHRTRAPRASAGAAEARSPSASSEEPPPSATTPQQARDGGAAVRRRSARTRPKAAPLVRGPGRRPHRSWSRRTMPTPAIASSARRRGSGTWCT